ncbi:hypothetical protein CP980_21015 [Streptomyces vinaceus]|uniref:Uncharacterized protein n=1 Tax=Streptomyces vinaceus TaxID=1960 RepID=A0A5J6JBY5_STRVI|nr:hypothetical protein [Streptomyces vinaceus]QEV47232.1 hypothetical protein CP980_21015 [Streptomyces vinaceus]GHE40346.1 hypothetical protein GCM10017778_24560 [Streptomyces vinaceus]
MPRPTAAQLFYGSATVVVSTIAMLLLSQTSTGSGIAVITTAALALGLLVALTAASPRRRGRHAAPAGTARATARTPHVSPGVTEITPASGSGSAPGATPAPVPADAAAAARAPEPRTAAVEQPVHH